MRLVRNGLQCEEFHGKTLWNTCTQPQTKTTIKSWTQMGCFGQIGNDFASQNGDVRVHLNWLLWEKCLETTILTKIVMYECDTRDCNGKNFGDFPKNKIAM